MGERRGGLSTPRRLERDHHVSVRMTATELRKPRERAKDAGLSLVRYLVAIGLQGATAHLCTEGRSSGSGRSHWLRHGHATHALERGEPVHLVAATLGCASIATTGKHNHARPTDSSSRRLAV